MVRHASIRKWTCSAPTVTSGEVVLADRIGRAARKQCCFNSAHTPDARNATPKRVAFHVPALVTGLPANYGRWLDPPRYRRLSRLVCRFFGGCSCRASAVFAGSPESSSSRYITGTLYIAIGVPFVVIFIISDLQDCVTVNRFDYGKQALPDF